MSSLYSAEKLPTCNDSSNPKSSGGPLDESLKVRQNPDDMSKLLSKQEACELLGIGHTMLQKLLNEKALPAFKIGRRTLIKKVDLIAYINNLSPYEGGYNGF